uniref:L1349 protein n=1 Tax=Saccharomyces cerevisiae TaxID=4932 RepID=E9PAA9_YEASX|nr:L1349 protein [Saccharomyces cerevisiae]
MNLPGVAMTMSGRDFNICSCCLKFKPPTARPKVIPETKRAICLPTSATWIANSRVGNRTITLVEAILAGLYNKRSIMGIINAAVLPEPVTAPAMMSLPNKAMGIVAL